MPNYKNDEILKGVLSEITYEVGGFKLIKTAITGDVRDGRNNEKWLNVIVRRVWHD